jgi:hypothetical protein
MENDNWFEHNEQNFEKTNFDSLVWLIQGKTQVYTLNLALLTFPLSLPIEHNFILKTSSLVLILTP